MSRVVLILAMLCALPAWAGDFRPTRNDTTMTITLVAGTRRGTIEACKEAGAATRVDHPGCTVTDVLNHSATVYIQTPADANDDSTMILGHEIAHVFWGRYHSKPE